MVQVNSDTSLAIDSPQGRKLFVFDRVFSPEVSQEGIWDYLTDSVSAFVTGYNVSLLAYGQSGAGKSYTMGTSGPSEQGDAEIMGTFGIPSSSYLIFPMSMTSVHERVCARVYVCARLPPTFLTTNPGLTLQ